MLGVNFKNIFSYLPYKEKHNRLTNYCPWAYPVGKYEEGIILLKPGSLMRCYSFICPDLGTASPESINSVSFFFNEAIKRLGTGWCVQFEAQRALSTDYPGSSWDNMAGYLIDRRRQDIFCQNEVHFVNRFFLILTYNLKSEIYSKTTSLLYKRKTSETNNFYNLQIIKKEIETFRDETEGVVSHLSGRIAISTLNNDETATFIHSCISSNHHPVICPKETTLFDYYITDDSLEISNTLKLGELYIPIVAIRDFPMETYPAMLNSLNASQIEFRWSTRWIAKDKSEASRDIVKYQNRFYGSRKSWGTSLLEAVGNIESTKEDPAAVEFEHDTKIAKVNLATDTFSFGYYTANIMVWDKRYDVAIEKARYIVGLVNSCAFNSKIETANAFNAFLSMMPGNAYANVRRPIISSGNLTQIIPLSSIWTGMKYNQWTKDNFDCFCPLLTCSTRSKIAFFLNLNVGDLGHAFIFGPSGAGKSTLLALLESQFLKYKNANVIILDKGKAARSITMAAGGVYVEPGAEDIAFQPLREIDNDVDLSWASEFIKLLLEMQNIKPDATMTEAISNALKQIRDEKTPDNRTMTTLQQYVNYTNPVTGQNDIKIGIQPYTINGEYGRIFDAKETNLSLSKWIMIEMGTLMKMGNAAITPALFFLFHFIEKVYTKSNGDPKNEPTLLVLDEAWLFLNNTFFARKIEEWLVTLRKMKVFCVFATQEVAKAVNSPLATTIISQCLTRIYLADPNACSETISKYYRFFELDDNEIQFLSRARMKRDYLYKSPNGTRMFELGLDTLQLALLSPNHELLNQLELEYGKNCQKQLACEILKRQGITDYQKYIV